MSERVTIQDIADALGVSRNTVSKAINNTGVLAESTRQKVLSKAIEMGYKQFSYLDPDNLPEKERRNKGEIAILSASFLGDSHFATTMLDKFQRESTQNGYSMTMHRITKENLRDRTLPSTLDLNRCAAILCVEVFDYEYSRMLCDLDIPLLLVDHAVSVGQSPLKADKLLMNNSDCIQELIGIMKGRGITKIGFIGDIMHCQSFFERYMAYLIGMRFCGLQAQERYMLTDSIEGKGFVSYSDYIESRLRSLDSLPELFVCSNDFCAIDLLQALNRMQLRVPEDVMICGFDDSSMAKVVSPQLTSIHIHTQVMGFSAMNLLETRIKEPGMNYRTVYSETNLILRGSTGD